MICTERTPFDMRPQTRRPISGSRQEMARIPDTQRAKLTEAIQQHDFLHRILRKVEQLLRVVFHAHDIDWKFVRAAAEEILMADILTRHGGDIDGVYFALRKAEDGGCTWEKAISDYANYVHNYFTTPLGVVIRKDLFAENCHFITTAAGRDSILYGRGLPERAPSA